MEQSNTQSTFVRILLKIARFIGIYILGIGILFVLGKVGAIDKFIKNPLLFLALALLAPLVWAVSKKFLQGFIRYAAVLFIAWVLPIPAYQDRKAYSPNTEEEEASSISYAGSYSADENGVQVKVVVSPNKWYGEVIEGTTGGLISNEGGDVSNNSLYDEYGTAIGEINGNEITMSIKGQRVRLKKD